MLKSRPPQHYPIDQDIDKQAITIMQN